MEINEALEADTSLVDVITHVKATIPEQGRSAFVDMFGFSRREYMGDETLDTCWRALRTEYFESLPGVVALPEPVPRYRSQHMGVDDKGVLTLEDGGNPAGYAFARVTLDGIEAYKQ